MKRIITLSIILWLLCGVLAYRGLIGYEHGQVVDHIKARAADGCLYRVEIPSELKARQEMVFAAYTCFLGGPLALGIVFQDSGAFYYGQRWVYGVNELSALLEQLRAAEDKNRNRNVIWFHRLPSGVKIDGY